MSQELMRLILDHTELGDPPRFNGVKLAEAAYELGKREMREKLDRLAGAAFLAGANPDLNNSRADLDAALAATRDEKGDANGLA